MFGLLFRKLRNFFHKPVSYPFGVKTAMDQVWIHQLDDLCTALNITFTNKALLKQALTHASVSVEAGHLVPDYEPLEFLGDAVLGLAIAHYLFENRPNQRPGQYSQQRSELVNRRMLVKVAKQINLSAYLFIGKAEEMTGGRERASLQADCLEALIGAMYLDQGWEKTRAFVTRIFAGVIQKQSESDAIWDYKSHLQNMCQSKHVALPKFVVLESKGPDHCKEFLIEVIVCGRAVGRGRGSTKKEAEQHAAQHALDLKEALFLADSAESVAFEPANDSTVNLSS